MIQNLTNKKILLFWMPLAATWLMMSVEGPLIAAVIARMGNVKMNLAAYGVAYAFALIVEAPIIMLLSASTALVKNMQSFSKLRNYMHILNGAITIIMLILLIPAVYGFILSGMMNLPEEAVKLIRMALLILIVWPAAIGYRRFYQGIMIRYGYTKRVAYGTVVRLISMSLTALIFFYLDILPGAWVGALALSAGVFFEGLAVRLMSQSAINKIPESDSTEYLTYGAISKFYYPLALTSLLGLIVQPALTFFMGQGINPLESLAVWPVVHSFVFIFRAVGLSYQEVAISLIGEKEEYFDILKKFAARMAFITSGLLIIVAYTPLLTIWLKSVSGLTDHLAAFAYTPIRILAILPAGTVWISFQRAVLVNRRNTTPVTIASSIEVSLIVIIMFALILYLPVTAVIIAAIALLFGRGAAVSYLQTKIFKVQQ